MNREQNSIDELLVKYLLGEADAQEHLALQQWRAARAENEKYYADFKTIWEQSKALEAKSSINEDAAWERMKQRIASGAAEKAVPKRIALSWKPWARIAAILLVCIGGFYIFTYRSDEMILVESGAAIKVQTLPDGSVVTLNKNASLSYPENFDRQSRNVSLKGEAFFNITPNKQQPFIIAANDVQIKVVGTSFNVKMAKENTEVIVETGIVEVSKHEHIVRLNPKEKAVVATTSEQPVKEAATDLLYNYYRTNSFECKNLPLWRVVDALNEAYGSHIEIQNPEIRELHFRTNLINQSLNDNLEVIKETLGITVEQKGTIIILK